MRGILRRAALIGRRGIAALEFAILMPVLTLILLTAADLGSALEQSIRLEAAARNGAQYALSYPPEGIEDQVRNSLPGWTDITIAPIALRCICPTNATVNCATQDTCNVPTQQFITISVSRPHTPLLLTNFRQVEGRAEVRLR